MLAVLHVKIYIFSPPQVKNKPSHGESEHAFILGPMVCRVMNNTFHAIIRQLGTDISHLFDFLL
jgi:hypothetical protein